MAMKMSLPAGLAWKNFNGSKAQPRPVALSDTQKGGKHSCENRHNIPDESSKKCILCKFHFHYNSIPLIRKIEFLLTSRFNPDSAAKNMFETPGMGRVPCRTALRVG